MVSGSRIVIVGGAHLGLAAALAAAGADIERRKEDQMLDALRGVTPGDGTRRTLLLDWPLTDPREEAARRDRVAAELQRRTRFRHPEGPCSYRPTGSKRTRRREQARRFAQWARRGCAAGGPGCTNPAVCACSAFFD